MAAITLNSWKIVPLNPDGTDNAFLNSYTGGVPATSSEVIDWLCMGANVRLELDCTISGTLPDTSTASVIASTIRYNPAMFLDFPGVYYPIGTFPQGGYSIQIPAGYSSNYPMSLVGQGEFQFCNTNGSVQIDIADDQNFTISHTFIITADIENWITGIFIPNQYRLSKNSIYNDDERNLDRPSVFGNLRGLNVMIAMKQLTYNVLAQTLSIPIRASFDGFESDGSLSTIVESYTITRNGDTFDELSPFEDNLITFTFIDVGAVIIEDESEVILVKRSLEQNVSTFVADFDYTEAKVITDPSTSQVNGAIYAPVTWSQAAGLTTVSFIIDGTLLEKSGKYQIHFKAATQGAPSDTQLIHFITDVLNANGAPPECAFDMESLFYSRNGNNATIFDALPVQRLTHVVSIDTSQYNTQASLLEPWTTFNGDVQFAKIEIFDAAGLLLYSYQIEYSPTAGWVDTDYIGHEIVVGSSVMLYLYLKDFRVPFANFQSLPDWANDTLTFKWSLYMEDPTDANYGAYYTQESELNIGDFDNDQPSPCITDVQLWDMDWNPLSDWHNETSIRVTAYLPTATADTYISVMVDRYPLGVNLFNDFALEEEDPTDPTTPSYVIFNQRVSDLLSAVPEQPEDNYIAFVLDVSELNGDDEYYLYIESFEDV